MNRRIFLRGLGGACVAAPFLGSLAGRAGKAQSVASPRRLVAMFTHYGCLTTRFFPTKSHGPLTAADLQATTLKHLDRFADKLLMPRGIRAMNEWTPTMVRGQGNDTHTQVVGSYFTCQPVTPNGDDPFSFEEATKFKAMPMGRSLDHVIAEQRGTTPLLIRVGNRNETPQSSISYSAAETPYPGVGTPADVFSKLTGLFRDDTPLSPDSYQAIRGKSIIDLVRDDLETLERVDMSQSDKDKLEAWKALLDDTGTVVASAQCNEEVAAALGATQPNFDAAVTTDTSVDILATMITDTLDGADVYANVAALAVICNASPVTILKYPPMYVYRALGIDYESHSLSHRILSPTGGCPAGVDDMLATIDDFHARKFAHLVGLLDDVEEDDGTVLDNCAAIWFQEMSDGNAHNLNNLPIVQVGSAGGYFKTGWAVNVADEAADLTVGNSEQACGTVAPDGSVLTTGTDPALANAPINKYFCNLMNALGVKAGEDGFPALGGTEEVTSFGMYDKTEDFVGGGTNPPMIHDPGEFRALKAT